MSHCKLLRTDDIVICEECGRSACVSETIDVTRIRRVCSPNDGTRLHPCMFFSTVDTRLGWRLYFASDEELDRCDPETYVRLKPDGSRVGTRIYKLTSRFTTDSCNCRALKQLMNASPLPFIQDNFERFVQLMHESALIAGFRAAPKFLIRRLLQWAIDREARRIKAT